MSGNIDQLFDTNPLFSHINPLSYTIAQQLLTKNYDISSGEQATELKFVKVENNIYTFESDPIIENGCLTAIAGSHKYTDGPVDVAVQVRYGSRMYTQVFHIKKNWVFDVPQYSSVYVPKGSFLQVRITYDDQNDEHKKYPNGNIIPLIAYVRY